MLERRKGSAPARTDQTPPNQRRVPRRGGGGRGGEIEGGKSSYLDLDRGAGSRLRCGSWGRNVRDGVEVADRIGDDTDGRERGGEETSN